ncbi:hypothetical protein [Streptomyces sp. NPDC050355]|uniref:hypothetical protein n=1 Tax=Streptomyces sp. NPDC050355 TaxID=3365609 RepID=UPI0037A13DE5
MLHQRRQTRHDGRPVLYIDGGGLAAQVMGDQVVTVEVFQRPFTSSTIVSFIFSSSARPAADGFAARNFRRQLFTKPTL